MRMSIPREICDMMDAFAPYLYRDTKDKQFKLREDAPKEIVQIKAKYDAWSTEHPICKES